MNWHQKKFRSLTLCVLILLVGVDLINYFFMHSESTSNAAHFGGAVTGFIIGIIVVVNIKSEEWEKNLPKFAFGLGLVLTAVCVIRNFATWAPHNIWETEGWCWLRFVYNPAYGKDWQCVRCSDEACISRWSTEQHISE